MDEENPNRLPRKTNSPVLSYGSGRYPTQRVRSPFLGELFLGFFFWISMEFLTVISIGTLQQYLSYDTLIWVIPTIAIGGVIAASVLAHINCEKRGFIPGVLTGLGFACLLPWGGVLRHLETDGKILIGVNGQARNINDSQFHG